jgi:hypothetical protein
MIPKATRCIYIAGKFYGDFQADYWHPECEKASQSEDCRDDLLDGFSPFSFARGCGCERGNCKCVKPFAAVEMIEPSEVPHA